MERTSRWAAAAVLGLLVTSSPAEPVAHAHGSCTEHPLPGGAGLGEAVNIDLGPDSTVSEVLVVVGTGFLRPWAVDSFSLDITITSIDGTNHFHGTDVVPLSDMTIFSVEGELADPVVGV